MRKSISMEQRFKAIVFLLNQNEVDAIAGYIPMTQPIFDSILDKCMGQRVDEFLGEFTAQYPEMLIDNVKRLEPEYYQYELSEDDGKVISNVSDGLWDKICRRIKEIDGKDNI